MDTIYALSSGSLPCGVAVVRVSGPLAATALERIGRGRPEPRCAVYRPLRDERGELIDRGLLLWFPAPASFTGEDVAEFHVHGSRAVVSALFQALSQLGMRLAKAGEFTRRAFDCGKLDLSAAEGLADLLVAETEVQRLQALRQADGALAERAEAWRERLLDLRGEVEARLDFSDEGDVDDASGTGASMAIAAFADEIGSLARRSSGERIRDGIRVAIVGPPNAGKSSLLNRLASREVAIATPEPGTTRDVLEVRLDVAGYPFLISDTAGLRDSDSLAEQCGIERARRAAADAELVLWAVDPVSPVPPPREPRWKSTWIMGMKSDLARAPGCDLNVSAATGEGIGELERRLGAFAETCYPLEDCTITRARHRTALLAAEEALHLAARSEDEVRAEALRQASDALATISGRIGVEDVLGRIFSEFCIGK